MNRQLNAIELELFFDCISRIIEFDLTFQPQTKKLRSSFFATPIHISPDKRIKSAPGKKCFTNK